MVSHNTIQYKNEYYYSGINPVEFRGHSSYMGELISESKLSKQVSKEVGGRRSEEVSGRKSEEVGGEEE